MNYARVLRKELPNFFHKASTTLTPEPNKGITDKYRPILYMIIDAKNLNRILVSEI